LQSSVKCTETALKNHQNALSFIQAQDGMLEAIGQIVDRMAELRTLAADVSKNAADVENYFKEFIELQDQLHQTKREEFNGVEHYATEEEWHTMKGVNKSQLKFNGAEYVSDVSGAVAGGDVISLRTKHSYQYMDQPDGKDGVHSLYDHYEFELYVHPSGSSEDGNIKLNLVNLQFVSGLKDPSSFGVDKTQTCEEQDSVKRFDPDGGNTITCSQWYASWFDYDDDEQPDDSEVDLVVNSYAASGIEADVVTGHRLHPARPEFCKLASQCIDGGSGKPDDHSRSNLAQSMSHSLNSLTNQSLLTITQFTNHISKDAEK
jgi:flagellin-like hook-associated protein FlgL